MPVRSKLREGSSGDRMPHGAAVQRHFTEDGFHAVSTFMSV